MIKLGFAICMIIINVHAFAQSVKIEKEVRMLALGDSYTIGQSVEIDGRWPHQFIDKLRTYGILADYPDYIATTGWTTRNLIQGIGSNLDEGRNYNLVSILIGVNNQYQGAPLSSYEPDLREIFETALDVVDRDKSRILVLSIPDYAYTPFGNGNPVISSEIDTYNRIKRNLAAEYGITYVDITPISREGLANPRLVAADGLHPSRIQYKRWVNAIEPRLDIKDILSSEDTREVQENNIQVYPNPASSAVTINAPGNISRISIFNAAGTLLSDQMISTMPATIDLSRLDPGIYTLGIHHSNDAKVSRRVLLIRQE